MRLGLAVVFMVFVVNLLACDLGQFTVRTTAKVLVRAQPSIQQESDYQLAHDAIPATLKTIEGFLVVDPENSDLIGILTEGYCQYGTAFVEDEWEVASLQIPKNSAEMKIQDARATHIFTRCLNYALKQLGERWQTDLFGTTQKVTALIKDTGAGKRDPMMWAALALGSLINHNAKNPEMLSYLSTVEMILDRVLEFDKANPPERKDYAALPHIAYGMIYTSSTSTGDASKARAEFDAALQVTGGKLLLARTLMGYRVGLLTNDQAFFHAQLKQVLETPPSVWPEQRLANEVAHRRARRYLTHEKELFH
jgi:hypothetical protein